MRSHLDSLGQLGLGPSILPGSLNVPQPLFHGKLRFHNDNILRPANLHGLSQKLCLSTVHPIEVPHPAQVPWREAGVLWILGV